MNMQETAASAVTVYPDRARVTRSGKASLEAGRQVLEIPELPVQLDPDSVRVSAHGTAPARLLGVEVQRAFYTETPAEKARELESQVEALQDEMLLLEARAEVVKQQRGIIDGLASRTNTYALALAASELSWEAEQALFDGLRQRAEKLDSEQVQLSTSRRDLERRLQQLKNQLDQLRGGRPRQRYTARVELEILQAGDLSVELSYVVSSAGWKPIYDFRLVEEGGSPALEVSYLAQVTQSTGEAWENVNLSLSTARPALASMLPELKPWYLRPYPVVPTPRGEGAVLAPAAAPLRAKAAFDLAAAPEGAPEVVATQVATAAVESIGAAVTYLVPGRAFIPADGAPHKVFVAEMSLPPRLDYIAAPRLVQAAYRRAKITNDSLYLLLPGPVNLFAGDEFIGATRIELTAPKGEIELYFGVDDRIKIERELLRRDVDKTLIGGKRRTRYAYQITLENLLGVEARLSLQDQIPVAAHEAIKVRLESVEPKPARQNELNILEWDFTLASKEKRQVRLDFSVEYPPEMQLSGLE